MKHEIVYTTPWYSALQGAMREGVVPSVLVNMKDGTRIWGKVHRYTLSQVAAEGQLALTGPGLTVSRPWRAKVEEGYWEFIVVNADDVAMLKAARSRQ